MTKTELLKEVGKRLGISFVRMREIYNTIEEVILEELKKENEVNAGLVKYKVVETKERKARNPKTGETIVIPASKKVKVVKSSTLKNLFKK